MNKKEILYFINAHRDGCTGDIIRGSLNFTQEQTIQILREMKSEDLIYFCNTNPDSELSDEEIMQSLVMISGGYTHPDYKDIY